LDGRNMQRHRHYEFIRFLNTIEEQVPVGKVTTPIVDNYATHKHPKVRNGPASPLDVPLPRLPHPGSIGMNRGGPRVQYAFRCRLYEPRGE
jgi:hypothetical protein